MTVAAVILVPDPQMALADADGEPALRRISQVAWAGGALPCVAVLADVPAELRASLEDLAITLSVPTPAEPVGIAWFVHGMRAATRAVTNVTAALLWPVRYGWLDPETVTSLVEAHGPAPESILRPAFNGQLGFPILIPVSLVERLAEQSGRHGEEAVATLVAAGVPLRQIELGDPGIVNDLGTPRAELPAFQGPPEPAGGPPPEWNSALGAGASEAPGAGASEAPESAPHS
jgi:CTP:molybdopterin cytidylyltransferase MocA